MVDSVVLEAFPAFDTLTRPPDDADRAALKALDFGAVPINRLTRFEIDLRCKVSRKYATRAYRQLNNWHTRPPIDSSTTYLPLR